MNQHSIQKRYNKSNRAKWIGLLLLSIASILLVVCYATSGPSDGNLSTVVQALLSIGSTVEGEHAAIYKIILHLRLPRLVAAVVAGFGLSSAGVCMQGITRNPLVSPFTIGISSAAAFGASIAIVFGSGFWAGETGTIVAAFVCALLCAALVFVLALPSGVSATSVILVGTAFSYLFGAGTSAIEYFADQHKLADVVAWSFGSFNAITWREVGFMSVPVFICTGLLFGFSKQLSTMATGDDEVGKALGLRPNFIRVMVGLLSVLSTASIVSFVGVIGFVGIITPHIARIVIGEDYRFLIPYSGMFGAILLMTADTIGKTLLQPVVIPVGIVVSVLGVPLFINLLLTQRKGYLK